MRRCFQCGKRTDAAQLTAVGDGEFCAACFRELLAAGAEPPTDLSTEPSRAVPARVEPPSEPLPAVARRVSAGRCLVCERRIDGQSAVSFLGGDICAACNAQMMSELRGAEQQSVPARAVPVVSAASEAPVEADRSERAPFTPGAQTRWCAGCERPMPGPGSYRVIAGEPYCPACVPFYSVLNLGASPRHPASPPVVRAAAAPSSSAQPACDCCGGALALGAAQDAGFCFCTACFTSDRELCLGVARARHRRKLEALRAAIDPGEKS